MATVTRREFGVRVLAGIGAVSLVGGCGDPEEDPQGGDPDAPATGDGGSMSPDAPAGADGPGTCTVYPQQTQGPFYLDLDQLRRDVTEGKPGTPLHLVIQVIGAPGCAPLRDLAVDIWQCDAAGVYSGYPGQLGGVDTTGQTFLRGTQVTDGDGRVQFDTVYPGWYPGRTTHIHFKVHVSIVREAVSQLYFPEDATAGVYALAPYAARGQKDTTNAADGVGTAGIPIVTISGDPAAGFNASLVVTVAG